MRNAWWIIALCVLAIFLALAVLCPPLPAYAQGAVNLTIDDLQMEEFPRARVLVTVRDANGVPILNLGSDRFEIIEDGRTSFPPSEITTHVNPDAVISIVMVIDISGSMEGKPVEEAIRAANALLDQLSTQDRAAIIAFADEVKSLDPADLEEGKELGFTTDKNAVRNVVNFLDTKIGWDTPLYDAIYKGVKMAATEPVGKRAVVVMTDGRDERDNAQGVPVKDAGSLSTPDDPINEANRYNIPIFSIGLGDQIDTKYMTRLAERTGGLYQQAPQPEELTPLFEEVVNQLKTQYVLHYDSTVERDGNYHSLMVRVNLPQGQDFDETKFQIMMPEPAATTPEQPPALASTGPLEEEATAGSPGTAASEESSSAQATPEPTSTWLEEIVDTVEETIEDRPALAVVIGVGVLLLIALFVALVIVLLRGRRGEVEEAPPVEFEESYAPLPPAWTPGPTDAGPPTAGPPSMERTEVAPPGWQQPPPVSPFGPPREGYPGPPADIPASGGTRVIERGAKHLAMLVDKSRPEQRYDLKGTVNIGRARDNQLVLDNATVSRHHAWVKSEGETFLVFDVGSANGTFVNDERVEEPRPLESGDIVRFGDVEFVFTKVF